MSLIHTPIYDRKMISWRDFTIPRRLWLVGGLTAALSSIILWTTIQTANAFLLDTRAVWYGVILLPALSSCVIVGTAAAAIARIRKQQQAQEHRFRQIFEGAAIGIGLDSLNGTILESNPALRTMLGYTQDELAQMTFAEFTHPEDLTTDVELFKDMIAGNRNSYQIEKRHLRKDGKALWVRVTNSLVCNKQGAPQYTIAVAENITQLKQAEARVHLYDDIVKRMQMGLLVWQLHDLNDVTSFTLVDCNPAAQRMLQIDTDINHLIGQPMHAIFPELLDSAFPKLYAEVVRSGKERDLGEVRYGDSPLLQGVYATKAFPLPNQCLGLVFEDISDRKQAEAALQQSEARFRVVAETASCAFMIYQGNHLKYVNPATERITGYDQTELLTLPFWELAHPDFRDLVRDRGLARQRGEAITNRYEIKILTKSGEERWVDMTAGQALLNGQPAAIATAYDITERKAAEAQLQLAANRERLLSETALRIRESLNLEDILNTTVAEVRRFLNADRVFIAQFAADGRCCSVAESVDPRWSPILGWETDDSLIEEVRNLFQAQDIRVINDTSQVPLTPFLKEYYQRGQVKAGMGVPIMLDNEMFGVLIVNQCSAPRQWQPFELDLLRKLGTQVEIAIQQGQLYHQLKQLARSLECQVEERTLELRQRMQELQQLNQVKDILLHAVTHDLRTPVHGTLMVLNHLRNKCGEAESVAITRSMLDCMIDSSDRQLSLLNSLMENHTGTPCPKLTLVPDVAHFGAIAEQALATLSSKIQLNQATVVNHIPTNLPPICVDAARIQWVLENLILNALKHNPPGRTIALKVALLSRDPRGTDASHPHPLLACTVADDGTGMDAEQCDRLFQLYVRGLDNHRLTGIGLGLHRCQQIIKAHGGTIQVESQPGQGTKIHFTLPLAP